MDLQERINVLFQGAELAQKAGALTIDDAYIAKKAMDALRNNVAYREAFTILGDIAEKGQKAGVFSLKDAFLLYSAISGYEQVIPNEMPIQEPQPAPQQAPQQAPQVEPEPVQHTARTRKTKESN